MNIRRLSLCSPWCSALCGIRARGFRARGSRARPRRRATPRAHRAATSSSTRTAAGSSARRFRAISGLGRIQRAPGAEFDALHECSTRPRETSAPTNDADLRKLGTFYTACMDSARAEAAGVKPLAAGRRTDQSDAQTATSSRGPSPTSTASACPRRSSSARPRTPRTAPVSSPRRTRAASGSRTATTTPRTTRRRGRCREVRRARGAAVHARRADQGRRGERGAKGARHRDGARRGVDDAGAAARPEGELPQDDRSRSSAQLTPRLGWSAYFRAVGLRDAAELNVGQPKFVRGARLELVANAPLEAGGATSRWQLLDDAAPPLARDVRRTRDFRFNAAVLQRHRRRCGRAGSAASTRTDAAIGERSGKAYVAEAFQPRGQGARARDGGEPPGRAPRAASQSSSGWATRPRRRRSRSSTRSCNKIGYPDRWRDYSALEIEPRRSPRNVSRAAAFEFRREHRPRSASRSTATSG